MVGDVVWVVVVGDVVWVVVVAVVVGVEVTTLVDCDAHARAAQRWATVVSGAQVRA